MEHGTRRRRTPHRRRVPRPKRTERLRRRGVRPPQRRLRHRGSHRRGRHRPPRTHRPVRHRSVRARPDPRRASRLEAELLGTAPDPAAADDLGRAAVADLDAIPADLHGSADYRKRVGAAMVARAWRRAVQEAQEALDG
ncbi:hypothetical protein ACU686_27850 [Yinghuangia aomiensis]